MEKYQIKATTVGLIYEWDNLNNMYYNKGQNCPKVKQEYLQGLDEYFSDITKDVSMFETHKDILEKLGTTTGFNYLLFGPPGTGKSSFVKALAHQLQVPIFCVKLDTIKPDKISDALCPRITTGIKIVLVEDFDRYLAGIKGKEAVPHVLNALDGVYPAHNTVRFFSANFAQKINENGALASRMRRLLHFDCPTSQHIFDHLVNIFPNSEDSIHEFIALVSDKNLPMRTINMYLTRFLMDPDPLEEAIKNCDKWFRELDSIKKKPHVESEELAKDEKA